MTQKTIGGLGAITPDSATLLEGEKGGVSGKFTAEALAAALFPSGLPDIGPLGIDITALEEGLALLVETYGTTLSAADYADAAETARGAAVYARGQAETLASSAMTYRDAAEAAAQDAIDQINFLGDDGLISRIEKIAVLLPQNTRLAANYDRLSDLAVAFGVVTELDTADTAWAAWEVFRDTAIIPDWDDDTTASAVVRDNLRDVLQDLDDALDALSDAIHEAEVVLLAGLNSALAYVFKRSASAPTLPSATVTYTFATGGTTGLNNGWTASVPAPDGNPLYVSVAVASGTGATDTIASGEWASAVIMAQDGATGSTGSTGAAGSSAATVFLYQRAASAPSVPGSTTTYTFATGVLSGTLGSWSQSVPSGSNPLYVTTAAALGTGSTDTIATGEWATPSILAQDGATGATGSTGATGAAGLNNALVYIFQRSVSTPSLPSATTTYTFATGVLTGLNNGWTQAVPAGSNPLYVSVATASANTSTDTIGSGEWVTAAVMAQDGATGATGSTGAAGNSVATVYLYKRSVSAPSVPAGTLTFTFATGVLASITGAWTQSIPGGSDPLYVTTATALGSGATDTIATGEWATPTIMAQDGATGSTGSTGSTGATGLSNALVMVFQRASSTPSLPSATTTYTFATGALTGLNNGWTQAVPAVNGNPLYVTVATASSNTATDTIASGEWASAVIQVQDGATGSTGSTGSTGAAGANVATVYLFIRSASAPSVPAGTLTYTFSTGVLASITGGWTQTVPAGSNPLYVSTATAFGTGSTDTILTSEWATPTIMAQDGATGATGSTGSTGSTGAAGSNNAVVLLYKRGTSAPTLPSGSAATFTFATGAVSGGTLNGWTTAIPAADGNPLWVTAQAVSSTGSTASLPIASWAAAVIMEGAGLNTATVALFQRATTNSAPAVPSGTLTYTFSTGVLASITGGWAQADPGPTAGAWLFVTQALALSTGTTDTIATGEWSTPRLTSRVSIDRQILGFDEKRPLLVDLANLGARYTLLVARATALGLSTTATTTARTEYLTYLGALSPVYDDVVQDTRLATTALTAGTYPTGWTDVGFTPAASGIYYTLTDNDAGAHEYTLQYFNTTASQTYTAAVVVKKDAVAATTRVAGLRFINGNGTSRYADFTFDTSNGTVYIIGPQHSAYGCVSLNDTEWLIWVSVLLNADNTQFIMQIFPAYGTNAGSAVSAQGSIDIRDPIVVLGNSDKLGRDALNYRRKNYEAALETLAKSISEGDVVAGSAALTGLGEIIIRYDSTGAAQTGELTRSEIYRLLKGGTAVTTGLTWSYTVISGTVNGFTSASGAQTISGSGSAIFAVATLATAEAVVQIKVVDASGVTYAKTVRVARLTSDAPTSGSTGGGTAASASSFSSFTASTMASVMATPTEFVVTVGGTSVALTASLSVMHNGSSATVSESYAIFQWWNGAAWADVGTETASNPDATRVQLFEPTTWANETYGQINISTSKTGLTAATSNRFRLMMRRASGAVAATYSPTGTAGAQG